MKQITTSGIGGVEYSSVCPFNSDNSMFLTTARDHFQLWKIDGAFIKDLPIATYEEPRWSRNNPALLYFVRDNRLISMNVLASIQSVVRQFSEYTTEYIPGRVNFISGRGESDISEDGDHFVLSSATDVFNLRVNAKNGVAKIPATSYDALYITPDNNVLIAFYARGTERYNGVELYGTDMQFKRQILTAPSHMDVTRDTNGDEVLIWADDVENAIVKSRLADGRQTNLHQMADWSLAMNISCPDRAGFALVSFYAPVDKGTQFTDQIVKLFWDGRIEVVCDHMSKPFNNYTWQPRGSISRDGTKALFNSNAGNPAPEFSNVYLLDLVPTAAAEFPGWVPVDGEFLAHFKGGAVQWYRKA